MAAEEVIASNTHTDPARHLLRRILPRTSQRRHMPGGHSAAQREILKAVSLTGRCLLHGFNVRATIAIRRAARGLASQGHIAIQREPGDALGPLVVAVPVQHDAHAAPG